MNNASHGVVPWSLETMTFQATSASQVLTFLAMGTPAGEPPIDLLDGMSLSAPEPGTIVLLGSGLLALAAAKKRRNLARRLRSLRAD